MDGPASERWLAERSADDDVLDLLITVEGSPVGLVSLHRRNHAWGLSSLSFWVAPDRQGVHREEVYVDGAYRNLYTYGLLAADA